LILTAHSSDPSSRRITLLGSISSHPAIILVERTAFPVEDSFAATLISSLRSFNNLGANDIYAWFLANSGGDSPPDLKINLIWPCTEKHIAKYSPQRYRVVTETPEIYREKVRPWAEKQRREGRLNWIFNILDGKAEQEDVMYRETSTDELKEGFLVAPDLNWDRKTIEGLHVLGLVERRDIWSLRDLSNGHVQWLKHMRQKLLHAVTGLYPQVREDQLKLYVHCECNS
jgi:m7GpppX diphosphatase